MQDQQNHIQFLNRYYSKVYQVYEIARKYYLLGRDALLSEIVQQNPKKILEIGCGTGRNLAIVQKRLPNTRFGAVEPCDCMREYTHNKYPWIALNPQLAEAANLIGILQEKPELIVISYSLSTIAQKEKTIYNLLALGEQGKLYIVDFGDLHGLGWGASHICRDAIYRVSTLALVFKEIVMHTYLRCTRWGGLGKMF